MHIAIETPVEEKLKNAGMTRAIKTAEKQVNGWAKEAYSFLLQYAVAHSEFMAEDVRLASAGIVSEPPSKRAWGSIFTKASRDGIIKRKGFKSVKNAKAHATPATLWEVERH